MTIHNASEDIEPSIFHHFGQIRFTCKHIIANGLRKNHLVIFLSLGRNEILWVCKYEDGYNTQLFPELMKVVDREEMSLLWWIVGSGVEEEFVLGIFQSGPML